jgi:hypothetical protein
MSRSMPWLIVLLLASGSAEAGGAGHPVSDLPNPVAPHAQPSQTQLRELPPAERQGLTVDLSSQKAAQVQQLYEELAHSQGGPSRSPH